MHMMNNGMNFGMDGPQVTGWWVNPQTGDKFNAVDTFFEDNNLLIKTSDGRLLNYNQIQNYIQTNNPDSVVPPQTTQQSSPAHEEIPAEILNELEDPSNPNDGLLIPDDDIYGITGKKTQSVDNNVNIAKSKINDFDIIDRALKNKGSVVIKGDICWKDFPEREIEMLIDVMNISENDVIEYYINNITLDEVLASIKDSIRSHIHNTLHKSIKRSSNVTTTVHETGSDFVKNEIVKKTKKK